MAIIDQTVKKDFEFQASILIFRHGNNFDFQVWLKIMFINFDFQAWQWQWRPRNFPKSWQFSFPGQLSLPKLKNCLEIVSFVFDFRSTKFKNFLKIVSFYVLYFRSTKAFMVKRLEAEGAEVVFRHASVSSTSHDQISKKLKIVFSKVYFFEFILFLSLEHTSREGELTS